MHITSTGRVRIEHSGTISVKLVKQLGSRLVKELPSGSFLYLKLSLCKTASGKATNSLEVLTAVSCGDVLEIEAVFKGEKLTITATMASANRTLDVEFLIRALAPTSKKEEVSKEPDDIKPCKSRAAQVMSAISTFKMGSDFAYVSIEQMRSAVGNALGAVASTKKEERRRQIDRCIKNMLNDGFLFEIFQLGKGIVGYMLRERAEVLLSVSAREELHNKRHSAKRRQQELIDIAGKKGELERMRQEFKEAANNGNKSKNVRSSIVTLDQLLARVSRAESELAQRRNIWVVHSA